MNEDGAQAFYDARRFDRILNLMGNLGGAPPPCFDGEGL
jgi:hypothetical protein